MKNVMTTLKYYSIVVIVIALVIMTNFRNLFKQNSEANWNI